MTMKEAKLYIEKNKDRFLNELFEVLRIPSVSAQSAHREDMVRCAEHLAAALVEAGAEHTPQAEEAVRRVVEPLLERGVDRIVLGCTHYPFLRPLIELTAAVAEWGS